MCFSSRPQTASPAPPPSESPRPLANPYPDDDMAGNLSQLRIGSKANARRRASTSDGSSDGAGGGATGAGEGRLRIPKTPPRTQSV